MAGEIQNRRRVKRKLSVVGLVIELMSDGDAESEECNEQHAIFADLVPFSLTLGCSKYELRY